MSKARLVITAIEIEGRDLAELITTYGVSRSGTYELLARYRAEGDTALEPRSRRPAADHLEDGRCGRGPDQGLGLALLTAR